MHWKLNVNEHTEPPLDSSTRHLHYRQEGVSTTSKFYKHFKDSSFIEMNLEIKFIWKPSEIRRKSFYFIPLYPPVPSDRRIFAEKLHNNNVDLLIVWGSSNFRNLKMPKYYLVRTIVVCLSAGCCVCKWEAECPLTLRNFRDQRCTHALCHSPQQCQWQWQWRRWILLWLWRRLLISQHGFQP